MCGLVLPEPANHQHQMEFVELIKVFFEKDVPALIKELCQACVILDFFGYW
jgi:hypothetical protein